MQPKKQSKVQYIGIFEEIDSFYLAKMLFLNKGQKNWAWVDPPPLIRAMPDRKRFFLLMSSLSSIKVDSDQSEAYLFQSVRWSIGQSVSQCISEHLSAS